MSSPQRKVVEFDRTITEGPVAKAVWKIAWPTMLQNIIAGLQGFVDHAMVGHFVGYHGNAAIGVSWQIFLVVLVFVSSIFIGMGVMVARHAGANDPVAVRRIVEQGLMTSVALACFVLAPIGYFIAPDLLTFVNAVPAVRDEALSYLRIMLVFNIGTLFFFMLGGALRSAGDAKTPLRLGVLLTVLNVAFNIVLIPGLGPIPALGTTGAAIGTVLSAAIVAAVGLSLLFSGRLIIRVSPLRTWRPDFLIIKSLFRFGLPAGVQGIAMNVGGVLMLRYIGSLDKSAEAQAAFTVCYNQLFSLITWSSVGLMGATAAIAGQNLGAGKPDRAISAVRSASGLGLSLAASIGLAFLFFPGILLGIFGISDPVVLGLGEELLRFLSLSGLFVTVALAHTGGLQGTGDTRSPLYITLISQVVIPLGFCATIQAATILQPFHVWLAILFGHFSRATLSWIRFRQGKWMHIEVAVKRN